MSHADEHRDHPGPHPALVVQHTWDSGNASDRVPFVRNVQIVQPPDWHHPGPRYIAQADLDPALAPGMTDLMFDPETLDAFMAANPLPDDLPPVEDVDWPEDEYPERAECEF